MGIVSSLGLKHFCISLLNLSWHLSTIKFVASRLSIFATFDLFLESCLNICFRTSDKTFHLKITYSSIQHRVHGEELAFDPLKIKHFYAQKKNFFPKKKKKKKKKK